MTVGRLGGGSCEQAGLAIGPAGPGLITGAGPPGEHYKNAVVVLCSGLGKGVQAVAGQGGGHAM